MLNPAPQSPLSLPSQVVLAGLRIAVGWHFLYEGLYKLRETLEARRLAEHVAGLKGETLPWNDFSPPGGFTSKQYLEHATGPFADVFHGWAANPETVNVLNVLVIGGLLVCGACLMLGLFTRLAALGTMGMLAMFYISAPPWDTHITKDVVIMPVTGVLTVVNDDGTETRAKVVGGTLYDDKDRPIPNDGTVPIRHSDLQSTRVVRATIGEDRVWIAQHKMLQYPLQPLPSYALPGAAKPPKAPSEGHYFLVNKNLIEFLAVLLLLTTNAGFVFGLDAVVRYVITSRLLGSSAPATAPPSTAQTLSEPTPIGAAAPGVRPRLGPDGRPLPTANPPLPA